MRLRAGFVVVLLIATACAANEPSATTLSPEAAAARFRADMAELRTVPEPMRSSIQTWVNQVGLAQMDPDLWQIRLDQACAREFWINTAALHALADEFVVADEALSIMDAGAGPIDRSEAYVALWIMALNHCRDLVPPEVVANGPPDLDRGQ